MTAAHNNLSVVYGELKDLEQATKHAYRAISLSKDSTLIYRTYSAIGKMFLLSGQYDSAYHYSRQGSLSPNIQGPIAISSFAKLLSKQKTVHSMKNV